MRGGYQIGEKGMWWVKAYAGVMVSKIKKLGYSVRILLGTGE